MDPTDIYYVVQGEYTFRSESGNDSESESEMDTPIEALGFNQVYGATHDGFLMRFVLSSSSGVTYRYGEGWCHYTQRWFQEPTYTPVDRPHFAHALVDEDRVYHIYLGARNRHDTLFVLQETYPNRDLHSWELEMRRDVRQFYYYITGNEPEMLGNDESEDEDENEEFEQPPASSEEPNVDPQGDDTRFHGFGGVDSEMSTSSHPNDSDPPVLGLGNVAPLRARQHPREQYTHVRDDDNDDTDHAEFLGLFVQRGDVVRTNDGEEECVYDPAAYPEDSD